MAESTVITEVLKDDYHLVLNSRQSGLPDLGPRMMTNSPLTALVS